jgi:Trk K+ transport system NAD-binding subunit
MPGLRLDQLRVPQRRRRTVDFPWWRSWIFVRVAFAHFRNRLLLVAVILLGGSLLFRLLEPERVDSLAKAAFYTWSLFFGEPPEEFPGPLLLQVMFFVIPVLGVVIVLESIVEFALMLRDRRHSERRWCIAMASHLSDHIVLVGMGKLGLRTYRLLRKLGETVVVIERNAECQFLEDVRNEGSPLLVGDARRDELLEQANIAKARSIILASNDDLANLEIALDARRLNPGVRVVLRMFDQNMADKIRDGFNIHIAMSQSAMSAPAFATAAIDGSIVNSFVVGDQLVVMQHWTVRNDGPLCGLSVGDVTGRYGFGIVERRAGGVSRLFPTAETRLAAGDRVIVQGAFEALRKLPEMGQLSGDGHTNSAARIAPRDAPT